MKDQDRKIKDRKMLFFCSYWLA